MCALLSCCSPHPWKSLLLTALVILNKLVGMALGMKACIGAPQIKHQGCPYECNSYSTRGNIFQCQEGSNMAIVCESSEDCLLGSCEQVRCNKYLYCHTSSEPKVLFDIQYTQICSRPPSFKPFDTDSSTPGYDDEDAAYRHGSDLTSILPIVVLIIIVSLVVICYCVKRLNQRELRSLGMFTSGRQIQGPTLVSTPFLESPRTRPVMSGISTSPPRGFHPNAFYPSSESPPSADPPPMYSSEMEISNTEPPSYEEAVKQT